MLGLTIAEDVGQPGQDDISILLGQGGHAGQQTLLALYTLPGKQACSRPEHVPPLDLEPHLLSRPSWEWNIHL